jgi:hypothetical protein
LSWIYGGEAWTQIPLEVYSFKMNLSYAKFALRMQFV